MNDESTLRTKGLVSGIMVSALVSHEFGFGLPITEVGFSEINKTRVGKKYVDTDASTYLQGNPDKIPLTETPFVRFLNYGAGKDGYWTYRHMVCQIEDCIDCLLVLHPNFDYAFELDHSSSHNAERPDGLSTTSSFINMGWGGK